MNRDSIACVTRSIAGLLLFGLVAVLTPVTAAAQLTDYACLTCVHDVIRHLWFAEGHTHATAGREIVRKCGDVEFVAEFRVTADGATASGFDTFRKKNDPQCLDTLSDPEPVFLDEDTGNVLVNPPPAKYGAFQVIVRDEHGVFFKYTHPTQPPPEGENSRRVWIGLRYKHREGGTRVWTRLLVHVYRPPVVMTHGLWSNAGAFRKMEKDFVEVSGNYPRELVHRVDYEGSNDWAFSDNKEEVEFGVASLLEQAVDAGYAVGKVDLVAHSMGGILSRLYYEGDGYNKDVRRVVTCNTPHGGSQMANWLLDEVWDPAGLLCSALEPLAGSCYEGAVCDLNVFSGGINTLLNGLGSHPSDVDVHALSTVSAGLPPLAQGAINSFMAATVPTLMQMLFPVCQVNELTTDIFRGDENDFIVALASQAGGLQGTTTSVYPDQLHVGSTDNQAVIDRVRNLLSKPKDAPEFSGGGYDPPQLYYTTPTACYLPVPAPAAGATPTVAAAASDSAATFCPGGRSACCPTANHQTRSARALAVSSLAITAPAPGAAANAGGPLAVSVSGSTDVATIVLVLGDRSGQVYLARRPGPATTFSLTVPAELAGTKTLVAIGQDAGGRPVAASAPVTLNVAVPATLQALAVYPESLHLRAGRARRLEVTGTFSDGVERVLSDVPELGFAFVHGHASRTGTAGVTLNEKLDDAVTVSFRGISAPAVTIRPLPSLEPDAPPRTIRRKLGRA